MKTLQNAQEMLKSKGIELQLKPQIPDAVYFCSIEPPSLRYQQPLETALAQLHREDPSFRVTNDETTMQTVLGGMGELHLEIIKSRILSEYKIEADLGPLQIAYKEAIAQPIRDTFELKKEISGSTQEVLIEMSLVMDKNQVFSLDGHPEAAHALGQVHPKFIKAIKKAVVSALNRGPLVGGAVAGTQVILHKFTAVNRTAESFVMSAASQCVQKLLRKGGCRLLEPLMAIQIILPGARISGIISDLSKRRAQISEIVIRGENKVRLLNQQHKNWPQTISKTFSKSLAKTHRKFPSFSRLFTQLLRWLNSVDTRLKFGYLHQVRPV